MEDLKAEGTALRSVAKRVVLLAELTEVKMVVHWVERMAQTKV